MFVYFLSLPPGSLLKGPCYTSVIFITSDRGNTSECTIRKEILYLTLYFLGFKISIKKGLLINVTSVGLISFHFDTRGILSDSFERFPELT